ncbi:hypothetical protein KUTeg_021915 [Tegillarca granosa]|uniref:Uncharacterized protein n=1 Tax=Tegillarca granosa TaxID=220873 RepID=A0ABQ9E4Q5_TEGGR|nr:hypothetical protein KUTeg_021915 [Tegillarca granosa]
MKPSTDLYSSCQYYNVNLTKSGNLDEEQKSESVARYQRHLEKAKLQRISVVKQRKIFPICLKNTSAEMRGQQPLSYQGTMHYSFDYAQQVHYPHYAQQVGPLFFKTPRKCQCFGICSEGSGTQIFYLIDESEEVGKGANSVVSMLHHHFHYKSYGETAAKLHMDNCAGQNKNNIFNKCSSFAHLKEFPLMFRVEAHAVWTMENTKQPTQRNRIWLHGGRSIQNFIQTGISDCGRTSNAETLLEIANTVSASSRNGHNISQLINDLLCPPLKELSKYHHFRMHSDSPGCVFVREYASDCEVKVNLFKKCISPQSISLPSVLVPSGLDPVRQWYLYHEIRPCCHSNKDITCPKPTVPKSENKNEKVVLEADNLARSGMHSL